MTKKNKTLWSLLGVAVVAGIAYLMTTEKGGRIRKSFKTKTQGLVDDLKTKGKAFASADKKEFASPAKKDGSAVPAY